MDIRRFSRRGVTQTEYAVLLACLVGLGMVFMNSDELAGSVGARTERAAELLGKEKALTYGKNLIEDAKLFAGILNGDTGKWGKTGVQEPFRYSIQMKDSDGKGNSLIPLEANSNYEVTIDLNKLKECGFTESDNISLSLMGWGTNDSKPYSIFESDSRMGILFEKDSQFASTGSNAYQLTQKDVYMTKADGIDTNSPYHDKELYHITRSEDGSKMTLTFSTLDQPVYVGMNVNQWSQNGSAVNASSSAAQKTESKAKFKKLDESLNDVYSMRKVN